MEPYIVEHWLRHKETAEKSLERALKNLARLMILTSGQMELPLETGEYETHNKGNLGGEEV